MCLCLLFLPRLTESDSMVAWAHISAQVHNVSHCWVCMELPTEITAGLPWKIAPANLSAWNTFERGIAVMPKVKQNACNQAVDLTISTHSTWGGYCV